MKRTPPLVILLDVLFVFLFVAILESPPKITYEMPPEKLFSGAQLIYIDKDNNKKLLDLQTYKLVKFSNLPDSNHGLFFTIPCGTQQECTLAKSSVDRDLQVVISGKTYDDISRLTFIGCNIDPSLCNNIHFTINEKGLVDLNELIKDNPFFLSIDGF